MNILYDDSYNKYLHKLLNINNKLKKIRNIVTFPDILSGDLTIDQFIKTYLYYIIKYKGVDIKWFHNYLHFVKMFYLSKFKIELNKVNISEKYINKMISSQNYFELMIYYLGK